MCIIFHKWKYFGIPPKPNFFNGDDYRICIKCGKIQKTYYHGSPEYTITCDEKKMYLLKIFKIHIETGNFPASKQRDIIKEKKKLKAEVDLAIKKLQKDKQ